MYYISEFVENQLIAYIGNKRRLLSLLKKAIENTGALPVAGKSVKFLDLFAGTGVVSRLAKYLGFEVISNDWEYYSYIINKSFIENNNEILTNGFKELGGIDNALDILNHLNQPAEKDRYISLNYCPHDDNNPDTDNERMFYTSYNGNKIDAIRSKIENWYNSGLINKKENDLLISLLLYEASTRSNTSGVFKGFHRGFGGTNGDALGRILRKIELQKPVLIDGKKCSVYNEDATVLIDKLKNESFDIVYLDPPYNQHQYGSNYHLLNTIALNDKPSVNRNIIIEGKKINKSAIRKDWTKTKSSFCYKKSATDDFNKLIDKINAHHILISYSTDGIIDFDEMLELLSKKGKLDITVSEYVKFRGGKQSLTTNVNNIEFVLSVNTKKRSDKTDIVRIKRMLNINKLAISLKKTVNEVRADSIGYKYAQPDENPYLNVNSSITKQYDNCQINLLLMNSRVVNGDKIVKTLNDQPIDVIESIMNDISLLTSITKEDEIYICLDNIRKLYNKRKYIEMAEQFKSIPYCLSKFNNKKAFSPSLIAIKKTLEMMIQTADGWANLNIINNTNFNKLEKIVLQKINYRSNDIIDESEYYKKKIVTLYEALITILQNSESNTVNIAYNKNLPPLKQSRVV